MKSFTSLSVLVALVASASAQLMVNTPSGLTTCEPSQITWTADGNAPYILSIVPGGQTTPNLKEFPPQTGNAFTWNVDLGASTIAFSLKDSQGLTVYSGQTTIQTGSSVACLNSTVNEGTATSQSVNAPSTGGASPSSTGSSGSSSGSTASSGSSNSKSTSGTSTGSASTQTQTKSGAASSAASVGVLGLAGIMGLVGAVLL